MPDCPLKRWLAGLAVLAGACLSGTGCHTSPLTAVCAPDPPPTVRMAGPDPRPDRAALPVGPHTVLKWTITSSKGGQALPPVNGESVVRADGQVDLGPYGLVPVGGLTTQQASNAIAKHVARYIPGVRVHLAAYIRPEGADPARHPGTDPGGVAQGPRPPQTGGEAPPAPVTPTGYQATLGAAQRLNLAAPPGDQPPLESAATLALAPTPDRRTAVKPIRDKDKDADATKKDSSADTKDKDQEKGDAVAVGAPPIPGPGFPPGHAPNELHKISLPAYVIEPPDILLVEYLGDEPVFNREQAIRGQHLVRLDGTISLGIYGEVHVAGLTLEQARQVIYSKLNERSRAAVKLLSVDVLAYNSKVYYVITDGAGYGEQIYRFPVMGSETVLDALSQIGGLPPVASKKRVWVARRTPDGGPPHILPVDYVATTQGGLTETNYQIMPGDRVYVKADPWRTADTTVQKVLSPIERILGATLLGSEVVNSIRNRGGGTGGTR
jgi:polysaccharide export outer membrane protein